MNDLHNTKPFSTNGDRKIAIIGGGISGLAAAYELGRLGAEFTLFEQSGRFGGIVETVREQGFTIECGPDSWVTEKPWVRELVLELGLENHIVPSSDRRRRTYLLKEQGSSPRLVPFPSGMRMMAPTEWVSILKSPLFSWSARLAYLREPGRAQDLKASAPKKDESVADFVRRHFGEEVTQTVAGPILSGIFGGDIHALSVRAAMPAFVRMEAEHGSLITALRRDEGKSRSPQPIFSTLASGLQTLIDSLVERLPSSSLHLHEAVVGLHFDSIASTGPHTNNMEWRLLTPQGEHRFHSVVLATPAHVTRRLLASLGDAGQRMAGLLPQEASSAILVALAFNAAEAARMRIPRGFGFLAPALPPHKGKLPSATESKLLACTFLDQKFPHCAPPGAVLLRAFFGGRSAEALLREPDEALAQLALRELSRILGPLPGPAISVVRRWPLSLPQYAVGHIERIAELESLKSAWRGLHLLGNAYHGIGLPDLIREGRATARALVEAGSRE